MGAELLIVVGAALGGFIAVIFGVIAVLSILRLARVNRREPAAIMPSPAPAVIDESEASPAAILALTSMDDTQPVTEAIDWHAILETQEVNAPVTLQITPDPGPTRDAANVRRLINHLKRETAV